MTSRVLAPCGLGFETDLTALWHEETCRECAAWNKAECHICGDSAVTLWTGDRYYCESHGPDDDTEHERERAATDD